MLSKKSIAIFAYKQRILSIEMKTKLVQHVKSEWMRDWKSVRVRESVWEWERESVRVTFEHRDENKSCSACPEWVNERVQVLQVLQILQVLKVLQNSWFPAFVWLSEIFYISISIITFTCYFWVHRAGSPLKIAKMLLIAAGFPWDPLVVYAIWWNLVII